MITMCTVPVQVYQILVMKLIFLLNYLCTVLLQVSYYLYMKEPPYMYIKINSY